MCECTKWHGRQGDKVTRIERSKGVKDEVKQARSGVGVGGPLGPWVRADGQEVGDQWALDFWFSNETLTLSLYSTDLSQFCTLTCSQVYINTDSRFHSFTILDFQMLGKTCMVTLTRIALV